MKTSKKKKENKYITIISLTFLITLVIGILLLIKIYKDNSELKITLISNLNIEINSKVNLLSFIKEIKNGEILTQDAFLDTSKLGTKKIEILTKDKHNNEKIYSFNINIIDTLKPSIEGNKELITYIGENIDLLQDVSTNDNSNEDIIIKI